MSIESDTIEKTLRLHVDYDTVFSTPGADDNASAVTVLIEVSRLQMQRSLLEQIE